MRNINRRESPRIDIQLRCYITSPALWMRSAMHIENISRTGILVAWRGEDAAAVPLPMVGQVVTVEIELPANHGFGQKCIHCQGTVTRTSVADEGYPRVALEVTYMDFRSFHDQIRAIEALQPLETSWMA
jgi:hypothetical protein